MFDVGISVTKKLSSDVFQFKNGETHKSSEFEHEWNDCEQSRGQLQSKCQFRPQQTDTEMTII